MLRLFDYQELPQVDQIIVIPSGISVSLRISETDGQAEAAHPILLFM